MSAVGHSVQSVCLYLFTQVVNQRLLLQNLLDTRMCNTLLVAEAEEDMTWKQDIPGPSFSGSGQYAGMLGGGLTQHVRKWHQCSVVQFHVADTDRNLTIDSFCILYLITFLVCYKLWICAISEFKKSIICQNIPRLLIVFTKSFFIMCAIEGNKANKICWCLDLLI